jgi:CDGSH-type Zn-finger protein
VILTDAEELCAFARFCDSAGGVWHLAQQADPEATALAVRQSTHCPSGRLVTWDARTQEPFEPALEPSIGVVQDPAAGVSGPLWVRGGIPVIAADGHRYEVRNRVTLCRCGASENKPFCNGSHAAIDFKDGLTELPPRSF